MSVAWANPPRARATDCVGETGMCQPPVDAAWAKPETMTPAMAVSTPANSTHARRVTELRLR